MVNDTQAEKIKVIRCARCGENHDVIFQKFSQNGIEIELGAELLTHWGMCPNLNEPILLLKRQK